MEVLYQAMAVKGNDVRSLNEVFLKAGRYNASLKTNGTIKNAKWGVIGFLSQNKSYSSRTDSLKQNFERYKAFGVIYNPTQDAVYYNGERVKLFVEFKSYKDDRIKYAFDLCYEDSKTNSTLYLEAVKDSSGKITKIQRLEPQIANELLIEKNESQSIAQIEKTSALTLDATQIIESYGITAKDVTKDKVEQPIKDWIKQCDTKQGAYVFKTQSGNQYTTYIYYNGGARYPWDMRVDGGKIKVNLYSNSRLVTTDGYYLMYFTAPKNYSDISLFLDNVQLHFANDSSKTTWNLGDVPRCVFKNLVTENIVVKTGGNSFKIEVDEASKDSYTFTDGIHTTSKKREIDFERKPGLKPDAVYSSTIYVTIPKNAEQHVLHFVTERGNISVEGLNCSFLLAESQSGNVNISNTKAKTLIANFETGKVELKNTTFDKILSDKLDSKSSNSEVKQSTEPVESNIVMKTATIKGETWYLIETEAELRSIGSKAYPLSAKYMLNADITLSKTEDWKPLGTLDVPFTGVFIGNGFEIINLTIKDKNVKVIGMFAYVKNAEIGNVTLRNPDIESAFQRG